MIKYAQAFLRKHSWFVALFQAALICFSIVCAWLLRFNYNLPDRVTLWSIIPILIALRLVAIWRFGLLHGWWKYTGASDILDVLKAVTAGSACFIVVVHYLLGLHGFPRSIYLIEPFLTSVLLIGVRISSRLFAESVRQDLASTRKIILIGAGAAAQTVVRETKRMGSGYSVIGCLDDDASKERIKIEGVPVLGTINDLAKIVAQYAPDEVLISVPSASGRQMKRFVEACEQVNIKFRTVPALYDVIHGKAAISQFRQVRIEDLLGRDQVQIDLNSVRNQIIDRVVMVTGAAGSIGSELCRQVIEYQPAALLCVDQSETGMFYLEQELLPRANGSKVLFIVADIGDSERMQKVFSENGPEVVFHAAAYKHVPVMEANVAAAVKNNVFGLLDLLSVAEENGCKGFVLISSDKAVNPTSTMGATKRLCELIVASRRSNGMRSVSVRFGNVLGSSGSVVPIFQEQLRNGKPLTVTHPEMRRFFMTTQEAVSLVLQAFAIGDHGDTLILDMGTPVKIIDLAKTLIQLSGKRDDEVAIKFTGLRPGEKLFEELSYSDEVVAETSCPRVRKVHNSFHRWNELEKQLDDLRATLYLDGGAPIRAKIKEILPEYSYVSGQFVAFPEAEPKKAAMGA